MTRIFIVEDDVSLRLLYEKALLMKGYEVLGSAKNGKEAVEMYKKFPNKPDVIIMDHRMPIKNGVEATREMLKINKKLKVIFISADKTIKNEALLNGAIFFTDKPCTIQELYNDIEKAINFPPAVI